MDNCKVLSNEEVLAAFGRTDLLPIKIEREYFKKLKSNLLVPSANQAYSCAIEYINNWFYSKFKPNYFKQTFIDSSHIMDQLRKLKKQDLYSVSKPAVVMSIDIDTGYNRNNLDLYNLGNTVMNNKVSYNDYFFFDREKNTFVGMKMEMLLFTVNFKMKFASRASQLNCFKQCQLSMRSNGTEKKYLDIDYNIPNELIIQLAEDAGYSVNACGKVDDIISFLQYLNSHSNLPFYYKFNASTGHMEYYIKVPRNVVHLRIGNIDINQGSDHGMLKSDFEVYFSLEMRFPSIQFYSYYSLISRENVKCIKRIDENSFIITMTNLSKIPMKDEHGWQWSKQTEYMYEKEEIEKINNKELLSINFKEAIGELIDVINYTRSIALAPESFLNIKVFSDMKEIPIDIDWMNYTMNFKSIVEGTKCIMVLYMDNNYFHNVITNLRDYDKHRVQQSDIVMNGKQKYYIYK